MQWPICSTRGARTLALLAGSLMLGCSEGGDGASPRPAEDSFEAAAARGERIYQNVCIACHNADPSQDAAVGPAVAGSSYELLEARVIYGRYPDGYEPKRPGGVMPKFEFLKDSIGDLEAYLAQTADDSS